MNIICDLDGTIALDSKRNHYLHTEDCPKHQFQGHIAKCICLPIHRDWNSYFDACDTDLPCRAVIEILMKFHIYASIYILSGRSMSAYDKTLKWLSRHSVPYAYLQMRGTDDRTDDHVLKLGWAKTFGLHKDNTLFVLEDRTRVVDAWRDQGFRCFQVAPGNF